MKSLTAASARAELERRWQAAKERATPEAIAAGHPFQLALLLSLAAAVVLMCSRRAGKTFVCCGLLLLTAFRTDGSSSLYLALTSGQARKVWARTWQKLLRRFAIPCSHSETDMITTFPNGATVQFGGTDDLRHIQSMLGDSMAGGLLVVDESQSDPGLMQTMVEDIFGPMLDEVNAEKPIPGRVVLAGTVPELSVGYFWEKWVDNFDDDAQEARPGAEWLCMGWSRFDNPHTMDNQARLEAYLRKYKLRVEDAIVQRNWFGRRRWDASSTAFRYRPEIASWRGEDVPWLSELNDDDHANRLAPFEVRWVLPPPGINLFGVGLDPAATADRFAIVLFGWTLQARLGFWQIAEAVTARGADALESQYLEVVKVFKARMAPFGPVVRVIRDAGSSKTTNDVLWRNHGIVIEPADKGPGTLKGRVDRFADLLGTGQAKVLQGSALEEDLKKTQWDRAKRALGQWKFSGVWHPDVADAATYIAPVFTAVAEAAVKGEPEAEEVREERRVNDSTRARYADPTAGRVHGNRRDSKRLWGS